MRLHRLVQTHCVETEVGEGMDAAAATVKGALYTVQALQVRGAAARVVEGIVGLATPGVPALAVSVTVSAEVYQSFPARRRQRGLVVGGGKA